MVLSLKLKSLFFEKFLHLFSRYSRVLIVKADNIGSRQLQTCRKALGKSSVLILGKNTIMRKVLKQQIKKNPGLKELLSRVSGNIGFIFTKTDPLSVKEVLKTNKIPAPAKEGQIAQSDVIIPPGPTGITPDGTPFFQALNIPTKIAKGQIEIQEEVKVISKGKVIQSSEVALLQKLKIIPFSYELKIIYIYDNEECYEPTVFELKNHTICSLYKETVQKLGLISKKTGYPIQGSVENSLKKQIASLFSIGLAIGYKNFETLEGKGGCINNQNIRPQEKKEEIPVETQDTLYEKTDETDSSESGDLGLGLFD